MTETALNHQDAGLHPGLTNFSLWII